MISQTRLFFKFYFDNTLDFEFQKVDKMNKIEIA